jgi:fluoride exporter
LSHHSEPGKHPLDVPAAIPPRPAADAAPAARRRQPRVALLIGMGGALGALARFGLGGWVTTWAGGAFPVGTFAVNVLGSLALGFVIRTLDARSTPDAELRGFLAVGVCGGFTTFSTFDYETLILLQQSRFALAALYSVGSVSTCVGGVVVGGLLAARVERSHT